MNYQVILLSIYLNAFIILIFVVLLVSSGATTIEKYDLRTNIWIQAGVMNGRRLQFGVAVIDDKLFVIGGRDGLKTLNTVECYNPKTKAWTVLPPMSTHRHGLGKKKILFKTCHMFLLCNFQWKTQYF